jgi:hypothetical protein
MKIELENELECACIGVRAEMGSSAAEWAREMRHLVGLVEREVERLPEKWATRLGLTRAEVLELYEPVMAGAMGPGQTVKVTPRLTDAGKLRIHQAAAQMGLRSSLPTIGTATVNATVDHGWVPSPPQGISR